MTSVEAILLTVLPTLIFFSVEMLYKFSKSREFSKQVFLVELHYAWTIVFAFHSNYSDDSEIYDFVILYQIICLWRKFDYWSRGE